MTIIILSRSPKSYEITSNDSRSTVSGKLEEYNTFLEVEPHGPGPYTVKLTAGPPVQDETVLQNVEGDAWVLYTGAAPSSIDFAKSTTPLAAVVK